MFDRLRRLLATPPWPEPTNWKPVAPPDAATRPRGLPPLPMPPHMRLDDLGPRPDLAVCVAPRSLGLTAMRSKIAQLESERNRLLANAAAALERIQVAERDAGGSVDEAEAILASVVTLAGTYIPDPKSR